MGTYIARRLFQMIPVIFLVVLIVFALIRIAPGDFVDLMLENIASGGDRGRTMETQLKEYMREKYGLDKPIPVQFGIYLSQIVRGDLGKSVWTDRPVMNEIVNTLPISLELAVLSILIALSIALVAGSISAIRQETPIDYVARLLSIIALSTPTFWTGTMVIVFMAIWFGYVPPINYSTPFQNLNKNLEQMMFPSIIMGTFLAGSLSRMVRSSLLEVMRQDYIRTAWAKGLMERAVIMRHALKNALIPVVTILGVQFANLLGGTVVIETIFALPGMGSLTVNSIQRRDYPQLQGNVLVFSIFLLLINLSVDVLYAWLDPRIKYR